MNLTTTLLVAAAVLYLLVRRFAGEPLGARRLVLPPLVLVAVGGYGLSGTFTGGTLGHAAVDGAVLGAGAVLAAAGGIVRGLTVRVFVRDGHLWYRYTALTVVVWVALIGLRFAQAAAGHALGADTAVLTAALPFVLGLSLLGEAAVVGRRGIATGVPFAPRNARSARNPRSGQSGRGGQGGQSARDGRSRRDGAGRGLIDR